MMGDNSGERNGNYGVVSSGSVDSERVKRRWVEKAVSMFGQTRRSLLKGIRTFTYLVIECGECRRQWRKLAIVAVNEENGRD